MKSTRAVCAVEGCANELPGWFSDWGKRCVAHDGSVLLCDCDEPDSDGVECRGCGRRILADLNAHRVARGLPPVTL